MSQSELQNGIPSASKLIGEIRQMYNKSRKNTADLGCKMIDGKEARREHAKRREMEKEWQAQPAIETLYKKSSPIDKNVIRPDDKRAQKRELEFQDGFEKIVQLAQEDKDSSHRTEKGRVSSCCGEIRKSGFVHGCRNYSSGDQGSVQPRFGTLPKVFNAVGNNLSHTIGEIVLQLEKRFLFHVLPEAEQTYYGTLADIRNVIASEPDVEVRARFTRAVDCRIHRLLPLGWDIDYHVDFGNRIMEKYGVGAPAFFYEKRDPLEAHAQLARLIAKKLPLTERIGMMTILSGLLSLALEDGLPLFLTRAGEEFQLM